MTNKNIVTELTEGQEKFCEEYIVNGYNGLRAYMAAYPNASEATARGNASRLMKNERVRAYITLLQKQKFDNLFLTAEKINAALDEIAFDEKTSKGDRLKALKQLSTNFGIEKTVLKTEDKIKINISIDDEKENNDERKDS